MSHDVHDTVGLEIARRIASGLPQHPEWLDVARANLKQWSQQNRDVTSLLRCYAEWEALLQRPLTELVDSFLAESDHGQRLRQNSPFAGVLSPQEVWEIKSRVRHATSAA